MNWRSGVIGIMAAVGLALVVAAPARAVSGRGDPFIAGYASAILERELGVSARSLRVTGGVVTLDAADVAGADRGDVIGALMRVPGVVRIDIQAPSVTPPAAPATPASRTATAPTPATPASAPVASAVAPPDRDTPGETRAIGFLPGGQLFKPLIADPRWPHFAAAYQHYFIDGAPRDVGAVSFGETFTFYRDRLGPGWWEAGIQAGVFAIFDLGADSADLINADYLVAAVAGYRVGRLSALARIFHQSSHLGDEFILRNNARIDRVNLSYEGFDVRLSYELLDDVVRIYGGGGYLFHRDPNRLAPGFIQGGLEFRSPWPGPGARVRPIAAADVQAREENDWKADLSLRAGVEIPGVLGDRSLQFLLEYFRGRSPNGQFYRDRVEYLGLGVHFHF